MFPSRCRRAQPSSKPSARNQRVNRPNTSAGKLQGETGGTALGGERVIGGGKHRAVATEL